MAKDHTTIWVPTDVKQRMDEAKRHPNQPYHELISELLDEREGGASAGAGARVR